MAQSKGNGLDPNEGATPASDPAAGFKVIDRRGSDEQTGETPEAPLPSSPAEIRALVEERDGLAAELAEKRERINELARGVQSMQADFDASRRRLEREKDRAVDRAKGQLLEKLLVVLDSFQHSLNAIPVSDQTRGIVDGVQMIYRGFLSQLSDLGLEQYDPVGRPFDPELHEAVEAVEVDDPADDGKILACVRPGYRHQLRVLRPAQVRVARAKPAADSDTGDASA